VPGAAASVYLRFVKKTSLVALSLSAVLLFANGAAAQEPSAQPPTPPPPPGETPPPGSSATPPATSGDASTSVSADSSALAKKESYGGTIIITDAVGLGIIAGAAIVSASADDVGTNAAGIMGLGVTTYMFGAPLVHAVHDNVNNGARSLVARLFLPTVGAAVGGLVGALATGNDHKSPLHESSGLFWGGVVGASVGAVAATVIDVVAWAHKDTSLGDSQPPPPPPTGLRMRPTFAATPTGTMAGLGGTF
jgi:hypothetical protein